jgi:hypothetical protein
MGRQVRVEARGGVVTRGGHCRLRLQGYMGRAGCTSREEHLAILRQHSHAHALVSPHSYIGTETIPPTDRFRGGPLVNKRRCSAAHVVFSKASVYDFHWLFSRVSQQSQQLLAGSQGPPEGVGSWCAGEGDRVG